MNVIPSTGVSFGFTGSDVLSNSASIVSGLATFLILYLALHFVPKLIRLMYYVFSNDWVEGTTFSDKVRRYRTLDERYTDD